MAFKTPKLGTVFIQWQKYFSAIIWMFKKKKVTKFNKTHFVGYLNWKLIDPSTLVEGVVKRLVWALCRAYSSLVSNHLVINNKISEWIRVVADTNGRDKQLPNRGAGSFWSFLQHNLGVMPDHTYTLFPPLSLALSHTHSLTHSLTVLQTHVHAHVQIHDSG